jgi:hypothetical protein
MHVANRVLYSMKEGHNIIMCFSDKIQGLPLLITTGQIAEGIAVMISVSF